MNQKKKKTSVQEPINTRKEGIQIMNNIRNIFALGVIATLCWSGVATGAIVIDGSFADWSDVPVLATDVVDNGGSIDLSTLQATDDGVNFYIRYTLHASINPQSGQGTFFSIDEDNNPATGFDVFALGVIGSEAGWQNDFPFEQATGVFNTGNGLTGATYAASPYNTAATSVEFSIPLSATHTLGGGNIFPGIDQPFSFAVYTPEGVGDFISGSYTQTIPEPSSMALIGLGALLLGAVRRKSMRK